MSDHLLAGGGGPRRVGGVPTFRFIRPGEQKRGGNDASLHSTQLSQVASRMLVDGLPTTRRPPTRDAITKTSDNYHFLLDQSTSAATHTLQKRACPKSSRTLYNEFVKKAALESAVRARVEHLGGTGSVLIPCTARSARVQVVRGENGYVRMTKNQVEKFIICPTKRQVEEEEEEEEEEPQEEQPTARGVVNAPSARSEDARTAFAASSSSARLKTGRSTRRSNDGHGDNGAPAAKTGRSNASAAGSAMSTTRRALDKQKRSAHREVLLLQRRLEQIEEAIAKQ